MGFLSKLFNKQTSKNPEDHFIIIINDELIRVEHPKRKTEQIAWENIDQIKLINTDTGPLSPDVWLTLPGPNEGCLIPQGAKGYDEVYDIVSKYKDFNFENVIKSIACSDNAEFVLWTKK